MNDLTVRKDGSKAVATVGDLNTTAKPEEINFIVQNFVRDVFNMYRAGETMTQDDWKRTQVRYAIACRGFPISAYSEAVNLMGIEREDKYRPTPNECRTWLAKAQSKIEDLESVAQFGITKDEIFRLQCAMQDHFRVGTDINKTWPERELGPLPGKPGCRLSAEHQAETWRAILRQALGSVNGWEWRPPVAMGFPVYRCIRNWWGIEPMAPDCPIPRDVLAEFHIPTTDDELARSTLAWDRDVARLEERRKLAS